MSMRFVLVLVALSGGCAIPTSYSDDSVHCCAMDDRYFSVVMERESGTVERTWLAACPKDRVTSNWVYLYKLRFDLTAPNSRPVVAPVLEEHLPQGKNTLMEPAVRVALRIPDTMSLYANSGVHIVFVKETVPLDEMKSLEELGFRIAPPGSARGFFHADESDGRWYLHFATSGDEVQLACPSRRVFRKRKIATTFSALWDPKGHRLVIPDDSSHGYPKAITIWNYDVDEVHHYVLYQLNVADLDLKPTGHL